LLRLLVSSFLFALALTRLLNAGEEVRSFDLDNEVVCRVNTEAVGKRQVEERMEEVALRLYAWRRQMELSGAWNAEADKKWNEMYVPPFRDALRKVVRERLMVQYAKRDPRFAVEDKYLRKRLTEIVDRLKAQGVFGAKGYTLGEVEKRIRDDLLMNNFRSQFANFLEYPTRPEIKRQYEGNIGQYQRKAGVKVRIIRIDRFLTNKLTGKQQVRENSYERAEELRQDLVNYSADFKEVAKRHSDDEETRDRGGLIMLQGKSSNGKDPFFSAEEYNPQLAAAIRGLKAGDVSKVFEFQTSWAIALLEETRESGPAPLEGDMYEEIYRTLMQSKTRRKEDEWFRKSLTDSLVVHVVDAIPKTLPVEFFFPDSAPAVAPSTPGAPTEVKTEASKGKG